MKSIGMKDNEYKSSKKECKLYNLNDPMHHDMQKLNKYNSYTEGYKMENVE